MHIYFSGIGGAGIAPLALIAKQAGYDVSGSDKKQSQYTDYLEENDITLHIGQTKEQIEEVHRIKPIDWLVFSSAVSIENPNHPELVFAKEKGIKTSKRDECLNKIIQEKNLKLFAIAGTHGKTTTTALVVWLFKQLNLPVSYSVGTKISFGPMGVFDPASQYFVYECDEFDRNFLSFNPFISVITTIDWDHHDIYPLRDDYVQAFKQFIGQSDKTFLFDKETSYLNLPASPNVKVLSSQAVDLNDLKLTGLHNRQNALVALSAFADITGLRIDDLKVLANSFPGSARRFEKIAANVYSDYAHTPEEISATLQMAHELSENVVAVYEPLTNRRQHYMKDLYNGVFEKAKKIYWLPSYLAREDPNQAILTPEELISCLDNSENALSASKDSQLFENIKQHAANGDLVICMAGGGGGSLDEWLRDKFKAQSPSAESLTASGPKSV